MSGRVRVLNVAEKPSVAKGITDLLAKGRSTRNPASLQQHPIWQFEYTVEGHACEMSFTSVRGHLQGFCLPPDIESNWQLDPLVLFDCPLTKRTGEDLLPLERMLKKEAKNHDWLILWLDCDREGENIAFEVLNICKSSNRQLRIRRARFSALIARDIEQSLRSLVDPNQAESEAVDIRMELDLRIGFAFTRFQTNRWKNKFEMHPAPQQGERQEKGTISYGPCQFPTLGFVVDQYWKHKHFKSESFWYLDLEVVKEGRSAKFVWKRGRLFDHLVCLVIYENLLSDANALTEGGVPKCEVTKVEKRPTRKYRPFPLTTVELQKSMSRLHHISSHDTMAIAEKLYQSGFVSYPRTETDKFPANFDFSTLIESQSQSAEWGDYATRLLTMGEFVTPKAGQHDDASHPPIHPLKFTDSLQGRDAQIYEFIVRHFLACCSQDALGHETIVEVAIGAEVFSCKGLAVYQRNYLEIYKYQKWSDQEIPNFEVGEMVRPTKVTMDEGRTTAPALLTEADLIQLMNQNGIGTDATIAEHIATIISRNYVVKKCNARMELAPTQLGEALVAGYNFIGYRRLNQPQLRAALESDLKKVCLRQIQKDEVLSAQIEMYRIAFREVRSRVASLDKALAKYFPPLGSIILREERNFSKCGTCDGWMSLREGNRDFHALWCASCNLSLRLPNGSPSAQLDDTSLVQTPTFRCPICNFQVISMTSKNGKLFTVCPQCYNFPPESMRAHLKVDEASGASGNMPCFLCTQQGCPLKSGSISYDSMPVRACPACRCNMLIRQSKQGVYMLSCSNYPTCRKSIFFPLEVVTQIRPTSASCPTCIARPSLLVDIFYSPREAFESGKEQDTGCLYGCPGGNKSVRSLLNQVTQGLDHWEIAPSPTPTIIPPTTTRSTTAAAKKSATKTGTFSRASITTKSTSATSASTAKHVTAKATHAAGKRTSAAAKKSASAASKRTAATTTPFSNAPISRGVAGAKLSQPQTNVAAGAAKRGASNNPFISPAANLLAANNRANATQSASSSASSASASVAIHRQPKLSASVFGARAAPSTATSGSTASSPFGGVSSSSAGKANPFGLVRK